MRLLQLHSDYIEYEPVGKEVEPAEEAGPGRTRLEDLVVLFVTIEKDDNEEVASRAVKEISTSLDRLKVNKLLLYPYSHLSSNLAAPEQALRLVKHLEDAARSLGLNVSRAPFGWTKAFSIQVKGHPLAEQSKTITAGIEARGEEVSTALVTEEKLVSRWYVLDPSGELTPVDAFDFSRHLMLEKFAKYEIAKVRAVQQVPPHVPLMKRLALADYEPGSDAGNLRYYPKGRLIKALLEQYVTQRVKQYGGLEVETPVMYDFKHPALAKYLDRFPARQYLVRSEDKELFLRFSACFGQFLIAKDAQLSYKQLPFKIYELTRYSFRREKSGELTGLRRLRAFTMPDCHCICANLEQAKEEFVTRFRLSLSVLREIGLEDGDYELAVRFTRDFYDSNREFILSLVKLFGRPALVELWEERFAYFIMKWEFNFVDNLDKASALSTDQIDVENGERFGITFIDEKGEKRHPIILHNSPSGAIERCIYALLEKAHRLLASGQVPMLPVWLSPVQVRIAPVSSQYVAQSLKLADKLEAASVRIDIDDREESVARKIRDAEREWIPYIIVYGAKEVRSRSLPVRDRLAGELRKMTTPRLIAEIASTQAGKPFLSLPLPRLLSERPVFTS